MGPPTLVTRHTLAGGALRTPRRVTTNATVSEHVNLLRLSDAYMCHQPRPSLVQVMAWCLFGAKSLSEPIALLLSIGPLETNFGEILIKIQNFSFWKMHLKILSAKWGPFCPGGDELTQ